MAQWWDNDPEERFWVEITGRNDIGADLHAPAANESSNSFWSYDLIRQPRDGDLVYHYASNRQTIVGYSTIVGEPWSDQIVWAAQGMSARKQGITPHLREGVRRGLGGYSPLETPVTKAMLVERRPALLAIRDAMHKPGRPSRFPFIPYGPKDMRAIQGYLTKLPKALFEVIPELRPLNGEPKGTPVLPVNQPPAAGVQYRTANEELAVGNRDPFEVDPALVERALKGHARTQNCLAAHITACGGKPLSPVVGGPNFDLAWELGDGFWVAEVKSCTASNQENQLRLGLGQILRYRAILARRLNRPVRAVLMIETEPRDASWRALCAELGVGLHWPGSLKEGVGILT